MRLTALAALGAGLVLGLAGFAPNMPSAYKPFSAAVAECAPPLAYDLGGGVTDIGSFSRAIASGC